MPEHATASSSGALKSGELVLLDYELWAEGGAKTELIDTTRSEVAQQANLSIPSGYEFGPRPHLLGGEEFPAAVEAAILAAHPGEEVEKEFAPAEAFGERDPKLIELFSMHEIERLPEMRKEKAELEVGSVLTIRGRRGRVASFTAARVRVDFNPPYAGKKVRAKFKVLRPVTEPVEKAQALIELTYGRGKDFHAELHDKVLTISLPDRAKFDLAWHAAAKSRSIERLRAQLHPKSIRFVEEYVTPTPKAEKKEPTGGSSESQPSKNEEKESRGAPSPGEEPQRTHAPHPAPVSPPAAKD